MSLVVPIARALAIGAIGGAIFRAFNMPLAWMIGAAVATTGATIAGARLAMPPRLRALMVAVLGVMLGSAFTPDLLSRASEWVVTLSALLAYAAVVGVLSYLFFRRVGQYDPITAFFSAAPGGLAEMTVTGAALGGDDRVISLVHTARVLLIVLTVPFWFRSLDAYDAARRTAADLSVTDIPPIELLVLAAIGAAGALAARIFRIPASYLIGPMIVSAAAHLLRISTFRPPQELVAVAQVVVGSAIGCRFTGVDVRKVLRTLLHAAGITAIMLTGTVVFALALHRVTGIDVPPLVLAFAPGGLAEMSLVALALATDAAFVSTHHVVRIVFVVIVAPIVFRLVNAGQRRQALANGRQQP
ncbi:MAG: AbrB family transcriptional regulator [Alphaproteobacteria bacterium]